MSFCLSICLLFIYLYIYIYLSLSRSPLSLYLSTYLPTYLSIYLFIYLSILSFLFFSFILPYLIFSYLSNVSNVSNVSIYLSASLKSNLFWETSSIFELDNIKNAANSARLPQVFAHGNVKNEAVLRDFLNFSSWQHQKRNNSARLPSKMESWVQSWRLPFLAPASFFFSLLLFSSLTLPTSAFPSVHIVGSFTSKLPSIIYCMWLALRFLLPPNSGDACFLYQSSGILRSFLFWLLFSPHPRGGLKDVVGTLCWCPEINARMPGCSPALRAWSQT